MDKRDYEPNETKHEDMTYDEFAEKLRTAVENRLEGTALVELHMIAKINRPKVKVLTIRYSGDNVSPAIELDAFYEEFNDNTSIDDLAGQIVDLHKKENCSGRYDLTSFIEYEQAKEHLECRLVNYGMNCSLLEEVPHKKFLDLAIVYFYEIENCGFCKAHILVRNEHIRAWGVSQEQLHEVAVQNTREKHPYRLATLSQLFKEKDCGEVQIPEDDSTYTVMYVLTNEKLCYGAVNIFFPDLLRAICRQVGDDFYVLPSSIHECIILPASKWKGTDVAELQEIVKEINAGLVSTDELLSDSVYRYGRKKHKLEIAV